MAPSVVDWALAWLPTHNTVATQKQSAGNKQQTTRFHTIPPRMTTQLPNGLWPRDCFQGVFGGIVSIDATATTVPASEPLNSPISKAHEICKQSLTQRRLMLKAHGCGKVCSRASRKPMLASTRTPMKEVYGRRVAGVLTASKERIKASCARTAAVGTFCDLEKREWRRRGQVVQRA